MIRISFLLLVSLLFISPVAAQQDEALLIPAGPKGEYTSAQGEIIALRRVPGTVLGVEGRKDRDKFYHHYKILAEDTSVYVVEVSAITGEVTKIWVDFLADDAQLPFEIVPVETATLSALNYIADRTRGVRKPKIRSAILAVREQNPVYLVVVKKSARVYEVVVDAYNGRVIKSVRQ